ncbi:MAG: hypothetical protein KKH40_01485 [Nanoarchaeota archaeon]|nr:hypothetical protein [Nanoarchaeota archaeon]
MTGYELSERTKKAIRELKLTPIESIFENKILGILYGNSGVLEYYNFEKKEQKKLAKTNSNIWSVHHDSKTKNTHYDDDHQYIICLENGLKQERANFITSINSFNGLLLDAGGYGLFNTETGKELISKKSLADKNIDDIESLNSFNNSLYALVTNNDDSNSVVEINTSNPDKFFIGEMIKNYDVKHTKICDFIIIPQGKLVGDNGKDYPFSIITCVNISYLDLNGEKIIETDVNKSSNQSIIRLKLIKSTPTTAEVIYSGANLNAIYKANINLQEKIATTKPIIENLLTNVLALQPIFKRDSHKHLSSIGEVITR